MASLRNHVTSACQYPFRPSALILVYCKDEGPKRGYASNRVPCRPLTISTASSSRPIADGLPVASTNSIAR